MLFIYGRKTILIQVLQIILYNFLKYYFLNQ